MAQHDKDKDIQINSPATGKPIDKRKGEMSVREAASMEIQQHTAETGMRGAPVHGFGSGTEPEKRHIGTGMPVGTKMDTQQQSTGEAMTAIVEQLFQLPFQAQLSVMRMMASRVLGAMDAQGQENFLKELRGEIGRQSGEQSTEAQP